MLTLTVTIREFVESIPSCLPTTATRDAIELFMQHRVDRLVVVNEQHEPIGIVQLWQLIPNVADPQGTIQELIESVPTIAHTQPLGDLEFPLELGRYWAVVDDQRFVGLVDSVYLRKLLDLGMNKATLSKRPSESVWHQARIDANTPETAQSPSEGVRLDRQLQKLSAELTKLQHNRNAIQQLAQSQSGHLNQQAAQPGRSAIADLSPKSLIGFLDRLPLPIMVQTNTGEVFARNSCWHERFGELADPAWIQHDAAALLDRELVAQPLRSSSRSAGETPKRNASNLLGEQFDAVGAVCQLGTTPNTCVCVCPMKNGQERTLQFVKIPLGEFLADAALTKPFRLATLHTDPDKTEAARNQAAISADRNEGIAQHSPYGIEDNLWLVLVQDITEQQQLARELAAKNADLIHLNRLKDEFLACISHELRTPLTAVLGLSSLLKDQLSGSLNDRQIRYAQLIYRSGRHLMAIVNDILDLTRIETGQVELTLHPTRIASTCDRAFEQARQLCLEEEKPEALSPLNQSASLPEFSISIEPGLEYLIADELRLRQMLVNLLSNALKFTPAIGQIGLKVSRWEGWIAFTVWDTGIGIPDDKQHLIFQKFQQLENPLTRRFEGAGLGLVLTQRLARLHGGDISFVSKEDQGSQFTLLLPPTHPQPTSAISTRNSDGTPKQASFTSTPTRNALPKESVTNRLVLVVDAVVRSIDQLSEALSEFGYYVVIARSGTEAVEKARRLQPCAVFLNPLLPTLSGWDVLTLLKAEPETRQIPVIITGTQGDRDQAYRMAADGFLSVPISNEACSTRVGRSLQQVLQFDPPSIPISKRKAGTEPPEALIESLVILRLSPDRHSVHAELLADAIEDAVDLNALLHSQNYRVIEADDLDQAELLAQVWKPNVVLLDANVRDPSSYLKRFGECPFLASLPLVTLDLITTQAANQVGGLSVFPCLARITNLHDRKAITDRAQPSALLQVIQVAAGFAWRPLVLAISTINENNLPSLSHKKTDWLNASMQYLQTAGFRGVVARSWQEVLQKLEAQSVDLLVINWRDADLAQTMLAHLNALDRLESKPPIVVVNYQHSSVFPRLKRIATEILPPMSMEALLDQFNQILDVRL